MKFKTWSEVRAELFTPEEIAESDRRVAIIGEQIKARDERDGKDIIMNKQKEPTYEEFFNDVRARLIRGRSHVSTESEIDNYLNNDADAKEEIEEKYNEAIKKYQNGETTYNKIFTHYAASAASCLNLMY